MGKIAIAMSGGVDSSVAAALAVEKCGKENIFGVTMRLFCYGEAESSDKSCCSLEAITDAKRVCDQLDIPHYVINFEKEFEDQVIGDFINEYEKGHTPNPCIRCNQFIKFESLIKKIQELGADKLATGHYARIKQVGNTYLLLKGTDQTKDQSYFLYTLNQEHLASLLFPIGELKKTQTRETAKRMRLKTAEKKESQDICFVPGKVEEFLQGKASFEPGDIKDTSGKVVGKHQGLPFYTIGQRKGLGGGFSEPTYVVGIDGEKNEIIVGRESELYSDGLIFEKTNWVYGSIPSFPLKCKAKIRYNMDAQECVVEGGRVTFQAPQRAVTPGQAVVFYHGDEVIGGGIISASF